MTTEILQLQNIDLSFGSAQVLKQLSFSVQAGEICALIGPNGAGKSSVINIVNGIYQPQAGQLFFAQQPVQRHSAAQSAKLGIARSFQNLALFKQMSVLDNVMTGRILHSKTQFWQALLQTPAARRDEAKQRLRVEQILQLLQLQALRHRVVSELPYGVQKRVELARALAAEPKLLLLDEPMAGMNSQEKQEISQFIGKINQDLGISVLMIEHDLNVVMQLAQHVIVLDYGEKIADGTPADIQANPEVLRAYLGASVDGAARSNSMTAQANQPSQIKQAPQVQQAQHVPNNNAQPSVAAPSQHKPPADRAVSGSVRS